MGVYAAPAPASRLKWTGKVVLEDIRKHAKEALADDKGMAERLLKQLDNQPRTPEARILAKGVDNLPPEQREQALSVFRAVFQNHADYFEKGKE